MDGKEIRFCAITNICVTNHIYIRNSVLVPNAHDFQNNSDNDIY